MTRMFRAAVAALALTAAGAGNATPFTVNAFANSSSGGSGVNTGLVLGAGQSFAVSVATNDLWSAGALPRWSNADGLITNLFATGSDESGQPVGTQIGAVFPLWTQNSLTAPYGSLVGELSGTYFLLGTSFSGPAPVAGTLRLHYWDSNFGDNSGSIVADVRVQSVPEPFALSLFATGLLALGWIRRKFL